MITGTMNATLETIPTLDASLRDLVRSLESAASAAQRFQAEALAPQDLDPLDFKILTLIHDDEDRATPGSLVNGTGLTSGAMTNRLDRLQKRGWIQRQPSASDRRSVILALTAKGLGIFQAADDTLRHALQRTSPALKAYEIELLPRLLRKVEMGLRGETLLTHAVIEVEAA
jgi:DNA-binding MarR family transcriptional regulator